ncbi:hypothetical protein IWX49DRAFT_422313 [Phyllosticta citricarpa]|uniref:Uncharacterized protein n=1 Tax=Phyllosticta citricarpa TaxID=55181 RepID=A0ABR1MH25_9PEZI
MAPPTMKSLNSRQRVLRWYKATTGSLRDVEQYKSATGAAPLEDTAVRCILRNLDCLDHNHLSCLPWPMRRLLWDEVRRMRLDSVRTWQMFVLASSQEQETFHEPKRTLIDRFMTATALDFTFKKATAPNFEWIVHLALEDFAVSESEWDRIKNVTNLASLLVYNKSRELRGHQKEPRYFAEIDDRVIKAWSFAAREEGAFSKLRVLHIHDSKFLTNDSLLFLASFPALKFCHFMDCNITVEDLVSNGDWLELIADDKAKDGIEQMWFSAQIPFLLDLYYGQSFSSNPLASPAESKMNIAPELFLYDKSTVELNAKGHLWLVRNVKAKNALSKEFDAAPSYEPLIKKRKLRAIKEKNIGDLLGQMGG